MEHLFLLVLASVVASVFCGCNIGLQFQHYSAEGVLIIYYTILYYTAALKAMSSLKLKMMNVRALISFRNIQCISNAAIPSIIKLVVC